jgi:hypothetical protein
MSSPEMRKLQQHLLGMPRGFAFMNAMIKPGEPLPAWHPSSRLYAS